MKKQFRIFIFNPDGELNIGFLINAEDGDEAVAFGEEYLEKTLPHPWPSGTTICVEPNPFRITVDDFMRTFGEKQPTSGKTES